MNERVMNSLGGSKSLLWAGVDCGQELTLEGSWENEPWVEVGCKDVRSDSLFLLHTLIMCQSLIKVLYIHYVM